MPFDYSTIFSGAEQGEVWLPDGTSHFQDVARTTAAGADDPVGSLSGDQGNFNANQGTSGDRPTLRQDGGSEKWYLDHASDYLQAGTTANWTYLHDSGQDAYVCMAVRLTANPDTRYTLLATNTTGAFSRGAFLLWISEAGFDELVHFGASSGSGTVYSQLSADESVPASADCILEIIRTGTTISGYLNGTEIFTGAQSGTSDLDSEHPLLIGAVWGFSGWRLTGRIYGLLITDTTPSDLDRAAIQYDMDQRLVTPVGFPEPSVRPVLAIPSGASRVYRVRMESPDSILTAPMEPTTLIPVNWQGRRAYDRANYLFVTLDGLADDILDALTDELESGATVYLYLESGYRTAGGGTEYIDLFRSIIQTIDTRSGPRASSTLISGFLESEGLAFAHESLTLGAANTIRTGNVARGWIGPLDDNLAPGDQVTISDTGEVWVVGNITYRVDARSAMMEVSELTDADLLAGLPW